VTSRPPGDETCARALMETRVQAPPRFNASLGARGPRACCSCCDGRQQDAVVERGAALLGEFLTQSFTSSVAWRVWKAVPRTSRATAGSAYGAPRPSSETLVSSTSSSAALMPHLVVSTHVLALDRPERRAKTLETREPSKHAGPPATGTPRVQCRSLDQIISS
jgi:hypothetical protein